MDEEELARLLDRYKRGYCTSAERRLVESLHLNMHSVEPVCDGMAAKHRMWQRLRKGLPADRARKRRRIQRMAAAACLVVIASAAWLFRPESKDAPIPKSIDIAAGGNKAILKMADGQTVNLDSNRNGVMILPDKLLYTDSTIAGSFHDNREADDRYNEIITPRGGTYQVVLADGTRVWLNADSKLTFPQRFAKSRREVTLAGEAYFEVAKNKSQPFVVRTAEQEIMVLGTSFNVTAYGNEPSEQTTLVEGEIKVATAGGAHRLSPGEQASVSAEGVEVGKVDTAPFVAWKSGFIAFNEEALEHIMADISRWYDVEVHFEGADKQLRFGGTVSRYANVSEVLRRLELTEQVHFKIEERGIVVKP